MTALSSGAKQTAEVTIPVAGRQFSIFTSLNFDSQEFRPLYSGVALPRFGSRSHVIDR